ncbi:MAG TPA: hypothetical protein VFV38_52600 [Ktedonobacteraceae bacterium]|nr:hypothetical protein [Ktedonobacteraceae bacterium]
MHHFDVPPQEIFHHRGRDFVGVQWQPSARSQSNRDVWFYQAADIAILQQLLAEEHFPQTHLYHLPDTTAIPANVAESLFPDGSYFGIGLQQQSRLRMLASKDEGHHAWS